jgi:aryl-alcohol dehydrogenase-like predicted oxidoreductase
VCVLSKAGFTLSPLGRLAAAARPLKALLRSVAGIIAPSRQALGQLRGGFNRQNFSPAYIERAIEGSLRRLATDYLDVFHLHNPRLPPAEMDALVALLDRLQRQGKIRFYGISGETVDDLIATLDTPNLSSVNVEINLLHQAARERLLPLCVERGIAVVGRQPFASGAIFDRDLGSEELREWLRPYRALAAESGIPLARLALQFVLQLAGISVVVVGMRTLRHLDANLSILASPPLGALALERLGAL